MGNCMKPSTRRHDEEEDMELQEEQYYQEEKELVENEGGKLEKGGGGGGGGGGLKVKIVLTKEELEWLMFQLKVNNGGGKKLEDILGEIERGRSSSSSSGKVKAWKPSLESIMESPES